MTVSYSDLFLAILSLDSYNRGYNQGIALTGNSIGEATITKISATTSSSDEVGAGFFAVAYNLNGQTVISYRGTDNPTFDALAASGGSDISNGWTIGAGFSSASQAGMAEQFYQDVTGQSVFSGSSPSNIVLTGHSLGGGLAAFIASLTGAQAVAFDNMPFGAATAAAILSQDVSAGLSDIGSLFSGSAGSNFISLPTSSSNVTQFFTNGEILKYARATAEAASTPVVGLAASIYGNYLDGSVSDNSQVFSPANNVSPVQLHSQALLVILMYADMVGSTDWISISSPLVAAMFNGDVANAIGFTPAGVGGAYDPDSKMLASIAYSAIDSGTMPFGDTGVASLFNDADKLGKIASSDDVSGSIVSAEPALAQMIVEYAGLLAKSGNTDDSLVDKLFTISADKGILSVDLTNNTWSTDNGAVSKIVGRDTLIDQLLVSPGQTNLRDDMQMVWGDSSGNRIGYIDFQANNDDLASLPDTQDVDPDQPVTAFVAGDGNDFLTAGSNDAFIVAGNGDDTIVAGSGNDILIAGSGNDSLVGGSGNDVLVAGGATPGSGSGNDTLVAGSGKDWLFAGEGNDSLVGGAGPDSLSGGAGNDTIRGGMGSDTINAGLGDDLIILMPNQAQNLVYGGGGNDTVTFDSGSNQLGAIFSLSDASVTTFEGKSFDLTLAGDAYGTDQISDVSTIKLTDQKDTLNLSLDPAVSITSKVTFDGGSQPIGSGDVLNASNYTPSRPTKLQKSDGTSAQFGGLYFNGDTLVGTNLTFNNFEILYGTNNGDVIAGQTNFKNIYLGNGNNLVQNLSGGVLDGQDSLGAAAHWVTVHLGSGNSTVEGTTSAGSEIYADGSTHHDKIDVSPDVLISGLNANDQLTFGDVTLHGGTRNIDSNDPWYYDQYRQWRFGVDSSGELVIERTNQVLNSMLGMFGLGPIDTDTYVANFQNGVTAGITLIETQTWGGLLLQKPKNLIGTIEGTAAAYELITKTWTDPLVVDLDGQGINISALDTNGGRFDLNGNGFAVASSWVPQGEGLIVTVGNDGSVKVVDGFADLAAYDVNGDGKIDDSDLSNPSVANLPKLEIWVDGDGNHQVDSGELLTFDQAGIASLSIADTTLSSPTTVADSQITATGTFTRTDGTTGAVADVNLNVDNFDSTYLGDSSLTANAAALPNVIGHGTLPSLAVALSVDERAQIANGTLTNGAPTALETLVSTTLASLSSTPDMAAWRTELAPILNAWIQAFPDPDPSSAPRWWTSMVGSDGETLAGSPDLSSYKLVTTNPDGSQSIDQLELRWSNVTTTAADGSTVDQLLQYYVFASGRTITDADGNVIATPTLAQALATPTSGNQTWQSDDSRPNYYTVIQTDANGTNTFVDDLEYTTTTALVTQTDPATGQQTQTNETIGYWVFGSGRAVTDANGNVIAHPTLEQALATQLPQGESWDVFTGDELNFLERYTGNLLPFGQAANDQSSLISQLNSIVGPFNNDLDLLTLRLVVQGPLKNSIFAGIEYDPVNDDFTATTDRGIEPVYEAIFDSVSPNAGTDPSGALGTLSSWNDVLQGILSNFNRGADYLGTTPTYIFANIVAAYEASGLALPISDVANAMGVDTTYLHAGTSGGGTVEGGASQNLFYVDAGNNDYVGRNAIDDYVVGAHFGNSTIDDSDNANGQQATELRFASLNVSDLSFAQDGADLLITNKNNGETLRIVNQFTFADEDDVIVHGNLNPKNGMDSIIFADGTTWNATDISFAVAQQNTHDQLLQGSTGQDVLFAGPGDTLSGGAGVETYIYEAGSGSVTIDTQNNHAEVDKFDTLLFGPGITQDDLIFSRAGNSLDLTISIKGTSDTITVKGQFDETFPLITAPIWFNRIDLFEFSDGSSISADELMQQMIQAEAASGAPIYGYSSDDYIDPGVGNKFMSGGDGNDTYIYNLGYGHDSLDTKETNFLTGGDDTLQFGDGITADNIKFSRPAGSNDLLISMPDGGSMLIQGQFSSFDTVFGILRYDYIRQFVFADGTTLSGFQVADQILAQQETQANILILGPPQATTFDDPHGNVTMEGDDFGNTYDFGRGYGQDTIVQNPNGDFGSGAANTIAFGEGIAPTDLILSQGSSPTDLLIGIKGTNDLLTILDTLPDYVVNHMVQQFTFADGTVWSINDMAEQLLAQESASDTSSIVGFVLDDTISAGQGDRYLSGGLGNDTYVYDQSSGNDTIDDDSWLITSPSNDTLAFSDIASNQVAFYRDGSSNDLIIKILPTGRTIRIDSQFESSGEINNFQFSDGVTWSSQDVEARLLGSEASNAQQGQIYGFADATTIEAGSGNKYLASGGGTTTYVYSSAEGGNDTIDNQGSPSGTLIFTDVDASDLKVRQVSNDVVLELSTGENITIRNQMSGGGVQSIQFEDGTIWSAQDISNALNAATIAEIFGTSGNDTLTPGTGDTFMSGGVGHDTYEYASEDGNDSIIGGSGTHDSAGDRTLLLSDLTLSDVSFRVNGLDLLIDVTATGKTLTIESQYDTFSENTIGSFEFADGTVLSAAQINAEVLLEETASTSRDIIGFAGDDTLVAGTGDRFLSGGYGSDTYIYSSAGGNDTILAAGDQLNVSGRQLVFSDIASTDVGVARANNGQDLVFTIKSTGKTIDIEGQYGVIGYDIIGSFHFADGVVWTDSDIAQMILDNATASDATEIDGFNVFEGTHQDTLTAGFGDRVLNGGGGQATFVYASAGGNDTIEGLNSSSELVLSDIESNQVKLLRAEGSNDLTIEIPGTGKTLDISGYFSAANGSIKFSDGIILDFAQISEAVAQTIDGTTGDDTLGPNAGDDLVQGHGGNDVYLYASGDGNATIDNTPSTNSGILQLQDLSSTDVSLWRIDGTNDLDIRILATGKDIVVKSQFDPWGWGSLGSIVFSDGTQWTTSEIDDHANQIIRADAAGSAIFGTSGADTLLGGAGDDTLTGGAGSDVLYGAGGGNLLVAGGGSDLFVIGADAGGNAIQGFRTGVDKIKIDTDVFNSFGDLLAAASDASGSIVATGHDGSTLTISGVTLSQIQQSDFTFGAVDSINGELNLANAPVGGADGQGNYFYDAGVAAADVQLSQADGISRLIFADAASTDVDFSRTDASSDLVISIPRLGKQITLSGEFSPDGSSAVESLQFADGTTLTVADIENRLRDSEASAPYGAVYGFSGDDTLSSGKGEHVLVGGDGSDVYRYSASSGGNDTIDDRGQSGVNVLQFTDVSRGGITFTHSSNLDDAILTVVSTGNTVTLKDELQGAGPGTVASIEFADGSSLQLAAPLLSVVENSDLTQIAPQADATLSGGGANDAYLYGSVSGNLTVNDHSGSGTHFTNTLVLSDLSASDVTISRNGNDLVVSDNETGKAVTVQNNFLSDNFDGIQQLVFANGAVLDRADIDANAWYRGGASDGSVTAVDGGGTLAAGTGNDTLVGGDKDNTGDDTYVYGSIDGNTTIVEHRWSWIAANNTLQLTDLNASDVTLSRNGNDLILTVNATGKTVTVQGNFQSDTNDGIQNIVFADDTSLDRTQIDNDAWYRAGVGDVTLTAPDGGGTLVAGPGNDTLVGGDKDNAANDTYVYGSADGNATIIEHRWSWNPADNTLELADLNSSDVTLSRSGNDLIIAVTGTGKTITVQGNFQSDAYDGIQNIVFADGTSLDRTQIDNDAWYRAGAGDVTITAPDGGGTLVAGPGNDTLVGGDKDNAANDTYIYGSADGNATIIEHRWSWNPANNTLELTDLNSSDVTLSRSGNDLIIAVNGTGKTITVQGNFQSDAYDGIQNIVFADGTSLDRTQIDNDAWYRAGSGDVTITAANGGATLVAGPGNDTLIGGNNDNAANDTYIYGSSDGNTTIIEHRWSWNPANNTLELTDLNVDDLTFSRNGNNLILTVKATGKAVTVQNNFQSDLYDGIQQIQFADGTLWSRSDFATAITADASSTTQQYDAGGALASERVNNPDGSYEIFTYGVTGQPYASYQSSYDSNSNLTSQTFFAANGSVLGSNAISSAANGEVAVTGAYANISLNSITVDLSISGPAVVSGSNDTIIPDNGVSLSVIGESQSVQATGIGNVISISSGQLELSSSASATIIGNNNTITVSSGDQVAVNGTGNSITVAGTDSSISMSAGTVTFADGAGGTVTGNNNQLVLSGGGAIGAAGTNESYSFGATSGNGEIEALDGTNTGGVLFAPGISDQTLWFQQVGDNLQIDLMGTPSYLTVDNWFGGNDSASVQYFETSDGLKLGFQVNELVSAMASYVAANPGFDPTGVSTLPNDPALQNAISTSWFNSNASVSYFLANQSALDANGAFAITDIAANISAAFDVLNADPNITSITMTDGGTPTLTLTVSSLQNDTTAFSKIANGTYTVAIADTAANVSAAFGALDTDPNVTSITMTDGGTPTLTLTVSSVQRDTTAFSKIANAAYAVAVADTAANVSAAFDALNADPNVTSITMTDGGTPALALTAASACGDTAAFSNITNAAYSVTVTDTATNISTAFDALNAAANVTSITMTDGGTPTLTLSVASARNDTAAFSKITNAAYAVDIDDTASNISAVFDALNTDSSIASIRLTDGGTPTLALTSASVTADASAFAKISNATYAVEITDTSANVSATLDALNGDPKITSITLSDSGTPTLSLDVAQVLSDTTALSDIANSNYAISVIDTAANVEANLSALTENSKITSITITSSNGTVLLANGSPVTLTGHGNSVALNNGATATVTGYGNAITETGSNTLNVAATSGPANSLTVAGSGNSATVSGSQVTLNSGASLMLSGNQDTVTENGSDTVITSGTGISLTANGTGNSATLSGGVITVEDGSSLSLTGNNNIITEIGSGTVSVSGTGNRYALTVSGTSNAKTLSNDILIMTPGTDGAPTGLTLTGNNDSVVQSGYATLISGSGNTGISDSISGVGNTATLYNGSVTLASNSVATIGGNNDSISSSGPTTLTLAGTGNSAALSGSTLNMVASSATTLTGDGNTVIMAAGTSSAKTSLTIAGNNDVVYEAGNATVTAGSADTGVVDNISGVGNTATLYNGTVNLARNAVATINGANNTIATGTSATMTLGGSGDVVTTAFGSLIFASGASATITAKGETITESGSDIATVIASGSGVNISVSGTGNSLTYNGGAVTLSSGASLTLTGNKDTVSEVGTDTVVASGTSIAINVVGTGNAATLNDGTVSMAASSSATVAGSDNAISMANGTSGAQTNLTLTGSNDVVSQSSYGILTAGSGSTGIQDNIAGIGNTATLSNSTVNLGKFGVATINGANNTITASSSSTLTLGGSGDAVTLSNGAVHLASGISATITGGGDAISESGSDALIVNNNTGFSNSLTVSGAGNSATLSGSNVTVASGSVTTINGSNNTITASGAVTLTLGGNGDTATIGGSGVTLNSGASATLTGNKNTIFESGSNTVVASGTGIKLTVAGTSNAATLSGGTVALGSSASVILFGNKDTIAENGSDTVVSSGTGISITVGGVGNSAALNSGKVTLAPGSAASINGNNNAVTASGAATLTLGGTGNTATISNSGVALNSGASVTITGNKDTITEAGSDTVVTSGTGMNLTAAGTGNAATLTGGTVTLDSGASVTITGNKDTVTEAGSDTVVTSGTGMNLTAAGTGNTATLTGGIVTLSTGASLTLTGNRDAITENSSDMVITSGTGINLTVDSAGNSATVSSGTITAESGSSLTLTGNNNVITEIGSGTVIASGTGNRFIVDISGTSNTKTISGASLIMTSGTSGALTGLTLTGNNDSVVQSGYATLTSGTSNTGISDSISGAGNTATLTGGAVTLASGTGATINGNNNTVTASGAATLTLNGSGDTATLSGSTVTLGRRAGAIINGTNDTITTATSATMTLGGSGDTVTSSNGTITLVSGVSAKITGQYDTIAENGADTAIVVVTGSGVHLTVAGAGNAATLSSSAVTLSSGAILTLTGNKDTVSESGSDTVVTSGTKISLNVSGAGNAATLYSGTVSIASSAGITLTGNSNTVNMASGTTSAQSNLTISGASDVIYQLSNSNVSAGSSNTGIVDNINGSNDTATLYNATVALGSHSVATINGTNNKITAATSTTMTLGGSGDTVTSSFGTITLTSGVSAKITGQYDTIAETGSDTATVVVTGSGVHLTVAGTGNAATLTGGTVALSSGASLTLTGNKDTVSEAGSDTVTTSGTGINVTVAGTGNAATLTHGTVTLGSNASATISGTGNTVTAGANNTISDSGSSTQIKVNSNAGNLLVNNFGSDSSGVIDLLTGGYASASAAYAALTSDGNGGSLLALGASGSIDIAGVAKSSLSAANFKIG